MENASSHVVSSALKDTPALAAIDAIRKSIKLYGDNAQIIHLLIANIIRSNKQWKAVISVLRQPDLDDVPDPAIIHGHLPLQYDDIYNDLRPEVDYLNIIEDDTAWEDLKGDLLDVYFYQAVNFKELERISDIQHGYSEEKDQISTLMTLKAELTLDPHAVKIEADHNKRLFDVSFYKAAATFTAETSQQSADLKVRKMSDPKTQALIRKLGLFNAY